MSLAFSKGWALSVIFDHTIRDGIKKPMVFGHLEGVGVYTSSIENEKDFDDVLDIVAGNLNLQLAIHDLIQSLNTYKLFKCGCGALRRSFAPYNSASRCT